jgi:RimJ/RimL family protein N-acetyltransferase
LNATVPLLVGGQVRLREIRAHDIDALFALHSDAQAMRHWSTPAWTERAQAIEHVERIARDRALMEFYPWVATLPDADTAIGTCSLFGIRRNLRRGVISYALASPFRGRGLAHEMVHLALGFAFDELGLERVEADIDAANVASARLAERSGFVREAALHERRADGGGLQETVLYALSRDAWLRVTATPVRRACADR